MTKGNQAVAPKAKMETKVVEFKTTEVKTEERNGVPVGIIEGYGATFDLDRGDDVILPGAFTKTLADHRKANRPIRMFWQHNSKDMIGGYPIEFCKEDSKGLFVRGEINLTPSHKGEFVYSLAKQGVISDMSIGFSIPSMDDFEYKENDDGSMIRYIKNLNLWEISPVTEPMNPEAQILAVKTALDSNDHQLAVRISGSVVDTCKTIADVENLLKLGGFSQKARKKLISLIKSSEMRDATEENPEGHRDDEHKGQEAELAAIGSKLRAFRTELALNEIMRNT